MIGFPNRIDDAAVSGGTWVSTLPLANIKSRVLGKVARTTSAATAATQFDADLSTTSMVVGALGLQSFGESAFGDAGGSGFVVSYGAPAVRIVAAVNHNLTITATARVRGSTVSDFSTTVYDSGWINAWPYAYTAEQREGFTATFVHILSADTSARYWRVEFDDTANPAGYIEVGRVFIGPSWSPAINISFGAELGWNTTTDVQQSASGVEYFYHRAPYRVQNVKMDFLTIDEGMANAFEIQRLAGIDAEVFWIYDPDDTTHALRRRFLGRLQTLSPVIHPYFEFTSTAFSIKEII